MSQISHRRLPGGPPLEIAFVNNMPDPAFEATERRFRHVLQGAGAESLRITCYTIPEIDHGERINRVISTRYRTLAELLTSAPDGLIVTGCEPGSQRLVDEPFWGSLVTLLDWACAVVPSAVLSCLVAHAALSRFDGIERTRLDRKCSGVFLQDVQVGHAMTEGMGTVSFPHSRLNEVAADELPRHGYLPLLSTRGGGWSVASVQRGTCSFLLLQGHPEYDGAMLLREYRRDVGRFASGEQACYPAIPSNYLGEQGVALLEGFRGALAGHPDPSVALSAFPFELTASHVIADWEAPSARLFANWLLEVRRRSAGLLYGEKGA